jgi:hypothetical protein
LYEKLLDTGTPRAHDEAMTKHDVHISSPTEQGLVRVECRCGLETAPVLPKTAEGIYLRHRLDAVNALCAAADQR